MNDKNIQIKFKNGDLNQLRSNLLNDLSKEYFAVLLGKTNFVDKNNIIINVIELRIPTNNDYNSQSLTHLNLKKEFTYNLLIDIQERYDVDTIIDIHTHPFSKVETSFSSIDDNDEIQFFKYLNANFENINYASIVFSQSYYSARYWQSENEKIGSLKAILKTQVYNENLYKKDNKRTKSEEINSRTILALGVDTLSKLTNNQVISIVGVGGIGSVIAENLVHMGFQNLILIDDDKLELSNLNRIVGATFQDAKNSISKVIAVEKHLKKINPNLNVNAIEKSILDISIVSQVIKSDWLIVATDNHSSRLKVQEYSLKYFIPFISVGVNISVENLDILDISGEVITIRVGDYVCLNCLKRLNPIKIAFELPSTNNQIKDELVSKGYVQGLEIKEPAVKTLNSIVSAIAVDNLINQYTENQKHETILVYENNKSKCIYADRDSVKNRNLVCECHI